MDGRESAALHASSIVIDGNNASNFLDPRILERLHRGGVTAVNATVAAWHGPEEARSLVDAFRTLAEKRRDIVRPVLSTEDIHRAKAEGKVGLIIGFQDTAPVGNDLKRLAVWHEAGVRIMQLTYNAPNLVGCGCQAAVDGGLTPFGRDVVREMNRLGILIDASHCGPVTTLQAIGASAKPISFTHANLLRFHANPRNKSEEAARALAAKGGVIGAASFVGLLTAKPPATTDTYVAAIDDLVSLIGIGHVGLGPDFMEEMTAQVAAQALKDLPPAVLAQFMAAPPTKGFESVSEFPNVTASLLASGRSIAEARKLLGENWLRLYGEVWGR
jgi:membrane dipeptidase